MNRASRIPRRKGLSLLGVLLALAILATSIALLGQLVRTATRSAAAARDQTRAALWCQKRLEEIGSGLAEPTAVQAVALPEDAEWVYSLDVQPGPELGLLEVRVTVERATDRPEASRVSLARWVVDPLDPRFQPEEEPEAPGI